MPSLVNEILLKDYEHKLKDTRGFLLLENKGMKVANIEEMRSALHPLGEKLLVVKNRLLKIALKDFMQVEMSEDLSGSTIVVPISEDPIALAKLVKGFGKTIEFCDIRTGFLDGQVLSIDDIKKLADIPSREVLLAQILMCMNAPISGFATVLSGVLRNMVGVVNAIKEDKEKSS